MALSFDPQQLPVLRVDSHLPPVPPEQLTPAALRRRFLAPPVWSPEIEGERRIDARESTAASVLVPIVQRPQPTVLLTLRTAHLYDHPGQISFPGGRADAGDLDATATALREAEEEIGLAAGDVHVLGSLPLYTTGTGFVVTPVIALVETDFRIVRDTFEVEEVFEVPLQFLMDPANHRHHRVAIAGIDRDFLSMPWSTTAADGSQRRYFIWGATASMLRNLYRMLVA